MRAPITLSLLLAVGLAGCATTAPRHSLVQSALADTHLGWQPAPKNQLSFSVATASGIARVELRPLPADLQVLTLHLPGMRRVEGVQWLGGDGDNKQLYDGANGPEGVSLQPQGHGFRLQISGEALELVRGGGVLTVIDVYRG
ncbi:hypothetical protein [Microbulbifer rhizosphaerae]|uniref:Uncharacterized protein n=1 Tax=Microbulbifer rhizosphaerae TaxID=1562603 RepID=A0A7W4WBX8_9GAMM|nr:hypothetical protein [Microbulbifer rhizosphaerae]MBB3060862.1 hypothetical protein [Microbulbifer rhizosphaerae]